MKRVVNDKKDTDGREVFRSGGSLVIWWVWLLFAVGNLIDLAIQGHDYLSLEAALILLFVTGVVYVTTKRPRLVADDDGLTITNPVRDHRVGWAAVAGADPTDLLRVRCEWPAAPGPNGNGTNNNGTNNNGTAQRAIYCWAVHSSRRRQIAADMRARTQAQRGDRGGLGTFSLSGAFGGFASPAPAPEGDPLRLDANQVIATLTERAEKARLDTPEAQASAPVSSWNLMALAAVIIPGLALLIAYLG